MRRVFPLIVTATALLLTGCGTVSIDADVDTGYPTERNYPTSLSVAALSCSGCHAEGSGQGIPVLTGQSSEQLFRSLTAYQSDSEGSTVMHRIARGYTTDQLAGLANILANEG